VKAAAVGNKMGILIGAYLLHDFFSCHIVKHVIHNPRGINLN